jgi:hypothetical protein
MDELSESEINSFETPPSAESADCHLGLPKNLARFFVRKRALFACSSRSHGRFYVAKWQGYVTSSFYRSFLALFCYFSGFIIIIYTVIYKPDSIELKGVKTSSPILDGHHNPVRLMLDSGVLHTLYRT